MCVVTTTSVWVAAAPMCFFILCDRLRPEGAVSFWVLFLLWKLLQNAKQQLKLLQSGLLFVRLFRWCDQSSRFKPHEKFKDRLFSLFRNNISHANNSTGRQAPLPNAVSHFFSFYPPFLLIHFPSLHVILLMLFFFLSS